MTSNAPPAPTDGALTDDAERAERRRRRRAAKAVADERSRRKAERRRGRSLRRARRDVWLRLGSAALSVLPLGVAARLGAFVGGLIYRLSARTRERVVEHLTIAFGDERAPREIERLAEASLRLAAQGVVSLPAMTRMGAERLLERVEVEGEHHLRAALERGRGVIVVTFHYGVLDAGATWLAYHYDGVVVSADAPDVGALRMLIEFRERLGGTTIERGRTRAIVRALRANRPVAIVADHDIESVNGVFVSFFGRLAHTPSGPAVLAQRFGATIVPTVVEWTSPTTHRMRFLGALRPRDDLGRREAAAELTHRFTQLGERVIRERPDHWLWLHRRWQTRPDDRPGQATWPPDPSDA